MSEYSSIPDSDGTLPSVNTAVRSMKLSLDVLLGHGRDQSQGAPIMYVQATEPVIRGRINIAKIGDLWINTATHTLHYWTGKYWQTLNT